MDRKYKSEFFQYTQTIRIPSNCNVITFVNDGGINVTINNFPLPAGTTFSIAGNQDEMDITEYDINFDTQIGSVWVIKKYNL